jgi:RND family efflux transporter MFP subunit
MHRSRSHSALVLVLGTAIAAIAGCGKPPAPLPPPEPPTVAVVKPKVIPLQSIKEFTGRLVTKDPVKVIPQVTGRLVDRPFKDGDYVEEGKTVLFHVDAVLFKADVEKAKADIARAKADIANWNAQVQRDKADLERVRNLVRSSSASASDVDKAIASVKVDEAQVLVSKANEDAGNAALTKAEENLKYCTIYAPTTGRLGQSLVSGGTMVDAYKTELVSVYPINPVYAVWDVDELTSLWYRGQIRAGVFGDPRNPATPINCTIKLKDEKEFSTDPSDRSRNSVVDYLEPELARGTGTRTVRATFENVPRKGPKGEIMPPLLSAGDSVRVRLFAGSPQPLLTVPESVIFNQQRKQYVYVVVDGKAQLREVEPGTAFDGMVEVNRRSSPSAPSGLDENDVVIADNLLRVRPGIPVTVK